jgi:septum formation protein
MDYIIENPANYVFILASASPRRSELLKMAGLTFKIIPSQVEEIYRDHLSPKEYVLENACNKGNDIAKEYPSAIVISADTIVVLNNEILEKPKDKEHARVLLKKLSGQTHQVYTGFGLIHYEHDRNRFEYEKTDVTFRGLSDRMIEWYLGTSEPYDKAGAYGAQGKGALLIERVNGCYFNVVGLPISKLFTALNEFLLDAT